MEVMTTTPYSINRPTTTRLGEAVLRHTFNLYDCDYINSRSTLSIDERAQIIIEAYERAKPLIFDICEYTI